MEYFKSSKSFRKDNVNVYHFILSNNNQLNSITKMLNINKIPSTFIKNTDEYKILHTNNFELHFSNLKNNIPDDQTDSSNIDTSAVKSLNVEKSVIDNKELYDIYGEVGIRMSTGYVNKKIFLYLTSENTNELKNQVVSYILGYFNFKNLNTSIAKSYSPNTTYFYHPDDKYRKVIRDAIYTALVQNEVREFVTLPANYLTSDMYVDRIKKNLPKDVSVKVLDENDLKEKGLNLLLSVNSGGSNPAYLVILEYLHDADKNDKSVCLVGKGVMFDAGGYNIKLGDFSDMKDDMAGTAVIYGVFKLLSHFKVKGRYVGLLAIVENKINEFATLPGNVVTAYNKKTVEILNTDAEGRLILADALSYSKKFNPKLCIDVATLTGAAVTTFGGLSTVVIGNTNANTDIKKIIDEGKLNYEKLWQLPLWDEYIRLTKSNVADYKNISYEISAGTIMGAAFLSHFIPKNVKWIHLDIAGVALLKNATNTRQYGGTGESMRTIFSFLLHNSKKS
jgi:leucyl aminopeptidase